MGEEYCSFNAVSEGATASHFPTEFLIQFPPQKLELEIGSPIFLMRNIDLPKLCNEIQMVMEEFHKNLIVAKKNISAFKNDSVRIPRITLNLS